MCCGISVPRIEVALATAGSDRWDGTESIHHCRMVENSGRQFRKSSVMLDFCCVWCLTGAAIQIKLT